MAFLVCLLSSCNDSKTYMPFQSSADGKWGIISSEGDVLFEDEFNNSPTIPMNDRFFVKNSDNQWEMYSLDKKPKLLADGYIDIAPFVNNVTIAVKPGEHISLINKNGEVIKVLDKVANHSIKAVNRFFGSTAVFRIEKNENSYYGCINTEGEIVIEPKYAFLCNSSSGYLLAAKEQGFKENDKYVWSILDKDGREVFSCSAKKYSVNFDTDLSYALEHKVIPVSDNNGKVGLLNIEGKELIKPTSKIDYFLEFTDDRVSYCSNDENGLMTYEGEVIMRPKYKYLMSANYGLFWAKTKDSEEFDLIDKNGDKVNSEPSIEVPFPFFGDLALAQVSDHEWIFFNRDLKELKKKNMPDIANVIIPLSFRNWRHELYGNNWVNSDYVDLNKVLSSLKLTSAGLNGWTLDMQPQYAAKVWASNTGFLNYDGTPDDLPYRAYSSISYEKEVDKLNIRFEIDYSTLYYTNYYGGCNYEQEWATEEPISIQVRISGFKSAKQSNKLLQLIVDALKAKGNLVRSNGTAAIIGFSDTTAAITYIDSGNVKLLYFNKNSNDLISIYEIYKTNITSGNDEVARYENDYDSCAVDTSAFY